MNIAESIIGKENYKSPFYWVLTMEQLASCNEKQVALSVCFENGNAILNFEFEDKSMIGHRLDPVLNRRRGRKRDY